MSRTKSNLLANRKVSIYIDDSVLCTSVTLSLSAVRMEPSVGVLTSSVELFAKEVVSPLVQAYLGPDKENIGLYLQGSDVPRDVYRLVQVAIGAELMDEMERHGPNPQFKIPPAKLVELNIRSSPDVVAPTFAPRHRCEQDRCLTSQPAREKKPKLSGTAQEVRTYLK
jgi:hypothetical protein